MISATYGGTVTLHSKIIRLVICFLAVFLAASTLRAQIDRASISGIVTDSSGAIVTGATVTVTNTETGQAVTVTTGNDGSYTANLLHIGTYSVEATASGFQKTLQSYIQLSVNQVTRVDLALQVRMASQV